MIQVRRSNERGLADHGWLRSRHTFSFADYYDPEHMGFRALRVINEDWVAPGAGFPTHPHRDMEIITYVLEGAVRHRDSMGNEASIRPGEVQRMSAGTGVLHSEYNASASEPLHLLQIWLLPERRGLEPSYEQRAFPNEERTGRLRLVAAPGGRDGAVQVHQDAELYSGILREGDRVTLPLRPGRYAWIQVARGVLEVNGVRLEEGDAAAIHAEAELEIRARRPSELLLFDLA